VADLEAKVKEQGDKVRSLKEAKASKEVRASLKARF
jgi:hypothetical protein